MWDDEKNTELDIIGRLVKMVERDSIELADMRNMVAAVQREKKWIEDDAQAAKEEAARLRVAMADQSQQLVGLLFKAVDVVGSDDGKNTVDPMSGLAEKIPTIKFIREKLNIGLKDAKDLVDHWQATERIKFRGMA